MDYCELIAATYRVTGQARLDAADTAGASTALKKAAELLDGLESADGEQTFSRACCHAALAGLAGRPGSAVSAGEGRDESDLAISLLRQTIALGFRSSDAYRSEPALDLLRNRPDFQLLMSDVVFPVEPFARSEKSSRSD